MSKTLTAEEFHRLKYGNMGEGLFNRAKKVGLIKEVNYSLLQEYANYLHKAKVESILKDKTFFEGYYNNSNDHELVEVDLKQKLLEQ